MKTEEKVLGRGNVPRGIDVSGSDPTIVSLGDCDGGTPSSGSGDQLRRPSYHEIYSLPVNPRMITCLLTANRWRPALLMRVPRTS